MKFTSVSLASILFYLCPSTDAVFRAASPLDLSTFEDGALKTALEADSRQKTPASLGMVVHQLIGRFNNVPVTDIAQLDQISRAVLYVANNIDAYPTVRSIVPRVDEIIKSTIGYMGNYLDIHEDVISKEQKLSYYCFRFTMTADCVPVDPSDAERFRFRKPTPAEISDMTMAIGDFIVANPKPDEVVINAIKQLSHYDSSYAVIAEGLTQLRSDNGQSYEDLLTSIINKNVHLFNLVVNSVNIINPNLATVGTKLNAIAFLVNIALPEGDKKDSMIQSVLTKAQGYALSLVSFADQRLPTADLDDQKAEEAILVISLLLNGVPLNSSFSLKYLGMVFPQDMNMDAGISTKITLVRDYLRVHNSRLYAILEKVIQGEQSLPILNADDSSNGNSVTVNTQPTPTPRNNSGSYSGSSPSSSSAKDTSSTEKSESSSRIPTAVKKEDKQAVSSGQGTSRRMKIYVGIGISAAVLLVAAMAFYFVKA